MKTTLRGVLGVKFLIYTISTKDIYLLLIGLSASFQYITLTFLELISHLFNMTAVQKERSDVVCKTCGFSYHDKPEGMYYCPNCGKQVKFVKFQAFCGAKPNELQEQEL